MKKVLSWVGIGVLLCLMIIGADFRSSAMVEIKKNCGYTIIEAGKGLNCEGDTIQLIKKHGYYELVTRRPVKESF